MNSTDEGTLAWALTDAASTFLNPGSRACLCAKIGAGEQSSAIRELLALYVTTRAELPRDLATSLKAWIQGYAGSGRELFLLRMYDQISISAEIAANERPASVPDNCPVTRLTANRSKLAAQHAGDPALDRSH